MKQIFVILTLCFTANLSAQFIVPDYRTSEDDEDFAFWEGADDAYTPESPPYTGLSWNEVNYPYYGGNEAARLAQYGTSTAFLVSNDRIYTPSGELLAFRAYDNPTYSPGEILFQVMTYHGSAGIPDNSTVKLFYRASADGDWVEYNGTFNTVSSSDPYSNQYTAWEWDTSSLLIYDYYIQFTYSLSHTSFAAASLDTNETYDAQIEGYGISISTNIPFGLQFGEVNKTPSKAIYQYGDIVELEVVIEGYNSGNYAFFKWVGSFGESTDNPLEITITEDMEIYLVIAPRQYSIWRQLNFPSALGTGFTANDWAATTDYDMDGVINSMEYAMDSNPESGIQYDSSSVVQEIVVIDDQTYPAITFPMQYAATDLTYTVALSSDLSNWVTNDDAGGPYTSDPEIISLNDDSTKQVRIRSLIPLDDAASLPFMKLNVSLED
ncbi:hypothetical protein [Cerasicoccus frondis]|uniref:hypothetical protein n=1 Tax=Cerasicoccus frondis TaxID=490090 RepID=UPI0028527CB8|nr:hypothetical protein [Cerasicoccus frondis]